MQAREWEQRGEDGEERLEGKGNDHCAFLNFPQKSLSAHWMNAISHDEYRSDTIRPIKRSNGALELLSLLT